MAARFARRAGGAVQRPQHGAAVAAAARHAARSVRQPSAEVFTHCSFPPSLPLGTWRAAAVPATDMPPWHVKPAVRSGAAHYSTQSRQGSDTGSSSGDAGPDRGADSKETKDKASGNDSGGTGNGSNEGGSPTDYIKMLLTSFLAGALAAGVTYAALSVPAVTVAVSGPTLASACVGLMASGVLALAVLLAWGPALPTWVPAALVAAGWTGQGCIQDDLKAAFRDAVLQEAADACSRLPAQVAEAASAASIREFETNRIHFEVEYTAGEAGTASWRLRAQARRRWFWRPWEVTFVEVALKEMLSLQGVPPPQVRHWSSDGQASRWRVVWHRGALYAPGKAPRSA